MYMGCLVPCLAHPWLNQCLHWLVFGTWVYYHHRPHILQYESDSYKTIKLNTRNINSTKVEVPFISIQVWVNGQSSLKDNNLPGCLQGINEIIFGNTCSNIDTNYIGTYSLFSDPSYYSRM